MSKVSGWRRLLGQKGSNIYIRAHFITATERNIHTLLPIRRQAIIPKRKVRLVEDTLTIDSKVYTVNNLDQSPTDLHPRQITTNETDNHLFFFSKASPFSNYYPSVFKIEGEDYTCREELIQAKKAKLFKDHHTYSKIKRASNLGEMKFLGREVKGFNQQTWTKFAPEVAATCQRETFSQNGDLRNYLISTRSKYLVEASPKDILCRIGMSIVNPDLMNKNTSWGKNYQVESLTETRRHIMSTSQPTN